MNGLNSVKALNFLDTHFSKKGFMLLLEEIMQQVEM